MAVEVSASGEPPPAAGAVLVLYDAACGVCSRTAQVLRILDRRQRLRLLPLQRAAAVLGEAAPPRHDLQAVLNVRGPHGEWWTGGEAALRIAMAVPALWSIAWVGRLPVIAGLVEPAYRLVARNRHRLGRLLGATHCRFPRDEPGF
ncbi:MAG: DUF393 domain-containing protein [Chloroflexi bacterium]|nr:DUF393 domain-containing protein [Chloroflexota bacterium]